MDVRMPDGYLLRNVPDGTPKEEIMSTYSAWRVARMKEIDGPVPSPTEGMSKTDLFMAGAGKAVTDVGRGAGQLLGMVSNEDVASSRQQDAPLMESGYAKAGNLAGNVAMAAPTAFVPGANTVTGAGVVGAGLGLLQPAESAKERVTNTALGAVLGSGGQKAGQVVGGAIGGKMAGREAAAITREAENAVRDTTLAAGRKAGYVVPPATANQGSAVARGVESLSGKAATQQTAAVRNQTVTNRLIREDLGLSGSGQTPVQAITSVRKAAGGVYESVSSAGKIIPDQQYLDDVANLSSIIDDVAADFPGATAPSGAKIKELADSMFQESFDSRTAVKYVKTLREQAKANFQSVHSSGGGAETLSLARAQREAADILEDQITRNLRATGKGSLADSFDAARVRVAKSYDAEAALNPGTGNFDATRFGSLLKRRKPLSGNMRLVGEFAAAFPQVAKEQLTGAGVSALSGLAATGFGLAGIATGNPALLAAAGAPVARGLSRQAMLSNPGQYLSRPKYLPHNKLLGLSQGAAGLSAPIAIGLGNSK